MSETVSLIDSETRALVGQEVIVRTGTVRRDAFQRWCAAVGDRNPLYFDSDYARARGHRDVVMPPLFLQDISHPVLGLDELAPDGMPTSGEVYGLIALPNCPRRMAAGVQMRFYESLYDGDEVTSVTVITSLEQKQGRSGEFVVAAWVTSHRRDDGTLIAEETRSLIARP